VTPLSLGIETLGGVFTRLIERNTTIPARKSETFSTAADNQTSVEVHVLQGEREMAAGNRTLGRFHLDGIPPAPRGIPQIEVTFDIDANGIVNVSAKDKATSKEQAITITSSSGLSQDEVEQMVGDAESHAADDKAQRERVEARNRLDSMIWQIEKMLQESGDKLDAAAKAEVEEALTAARQDLESDDPDRIRGGAERLEKASHKLAESMYQSATQAAGGSGQPGEPPGPEPGGPSGGEARPGDDAQVIDAEVVDEGK
jgi:molecular chaperone DnaK